MKWKRLRIGGNRAGSRTAFAFVDEDDYEGVAQYRWSVSAKRNTDIAIRRGRRKTDGSYVLLSLHREIMGLEPGDPRQVDHRNGNGLDCRKANLRVVTHAENAQNRPRTVHQRRSIKTGKKQRTSQHRGVVYAPGAPGKQHRYPWMASLRFPTEQEAAEWRQRWEREYMPYADPAHN